MRELEFQERITMIHKILAGITENKGGEERLGMHLRRKPRAEVTYMEKRQVLRPLEVGTRNIKKVWFW